VWAIKQIEQSQARANARFELASLSARIRLAMRVRTRASLLSPRQMPDLSYTIFLISSNVAVFIASSVDFLAAAVSGRLIHPF